MLCDINPHPRDKQILFDEPSHTYTINGDSDYMSATTFVHSNFPEFDEDAIIQKMMSSPHWTRNKYYPMSAEEIKQIWEETRNDAADAGTKMHAMIEDFYNGILAYEDIPTESVEMGYFKQFRIDYELESNLVPYRSEWRVFHEELKIAGTIDMVFKNPDGRLSIVDWKRCRNMKKYVNPSFDNATSLNPALSSLFDTNYYHYTLQLNLYKHILETKYGETVKELVLVNLHPINLGQTYEFYEVDVLSPEEIAGLYSWRQAISTKKA